MLPPPAFPPPPPQAPSFCSGVACSWDSGSSTLSLTLSAPVASGTEVVLTVDVANGISLPAEGVAQDEPLLTLAASGAKTRTDGALACASALCHGAALRM